LLTNGALQMNKSFNLDASALAGGIIINGNQTGNNGVFDSIAGITNVFTALTITNGFADPAAGGGGGGIYIKIGTVTINNSTFANNSASAGPGGGIYNFVGTLNLVNSIVCGNVAPSNPNIYGFINSGANNLVDANALLAPLGNYGGPTQTMQPLPGSPAIDAGSDSVTNFLATDQRGLLRKSGAHVDIGAVEVNFNPVVLNTNDSGAGSLRQIIADAIPGSAITFAPNLSGQTILLTNGALQMNKSFNLDASALAGGIIINGNHTSNNGVFDSIAGITNVFTALTITNGFANPAAGGGGIVSRGNLMLNRCTLAGNSAGFGGGVYNEGVLTVNNSTFANNSSSGLGGGAYNTGGSLTLNNCTLAGNTASFDGGALDNANGGTALLVQCTVVANTAPSHGGGLNNQGTSLTVRNCTIVMNTGQGGGIYNNSTLNLTSSIVCSNTSSGAQDNISGNFYSSANNLVDTNALLAPLGSYGGPTLTMPPLPGSPAIDAGAATTLTTDQRGYPRVAGAAVDIGAVEGVYEANYAGPGPLKHVTRLGNGSFQFSFTNYTDMSLTVEASTNLSLPFAQWSNVGTPVESPAGTFTFTDPQATNSPQRFYRVSSP
jgi:hypothetical protein